MENETLPFPQGPLIPRRERKGIARATESKYEVHEHAFIRGRRSGQKLQHSHEDGSTPHEHPDTGPASYTIDKDEWARATGMKGGGRKSFTKSPDGDQFPFVRLSAEQSTFQVIYCEQPTGSNYDGYEGGGLAAAARMTLQCFG